VRRGVKALRRDTLQLGKKEGASGIGVPQARQELMVLRATDPAAVGCMRALKQLLPQSDFDWLTGQMAAADTERAKTKKRPSLRSRSKATLGTTSKADTWVTQKMATVRLASHAPSLGATAIRGVRASDKPVAEASSTSSESSFGTDAQALMRLPFMPSFKAPLIKPDAQGHKPPKPRYALLATAAMQDANAPVLTTHSVIAGGVGKVCWGIDGLGQSYADKVFRTVDNDWAEHHVAEYEALVAGDDKKTRLVDAMNVVAEAERTERLRGAIEARCARFDAPWCPDDDALKTVRTGVHPFHVTALIAMPVKHHVQKMHMLMTRADGDLFGLLQHIHRENRPALIFSAFAQIFSELAALEDVNVAHHDMRADIGDRHQRRSVKAYCPLQCICWPSLAVWRRHFLFFLGSLELQKGSNGRFSPFYISHWFLVLKQSLPKYAEI
jgi:hypothetical protein